MGNCFVNHHHHHHLPVPEEGVPDQPEEDQSVHFYPDNLLAHRPFEIGSAGLNFYIVKKRKPVDPGIIKWKLQTSELKYLGRYHNPNMVNIVGEHISANGNPYLVNNFVPNGNLRQHLDGDYGLLSWEAREKICIGMAEEIEYHKRTSPRINWDHLKSEHILLGLDYNPKISTSTIPTTDYTPHLLRRDVYGIGVVFLEIITGLKAIDNTRPVEHQKLEDWVRHCIRDIHGMDEWDFKLQEQIEEVIDHRLQGKHLSTSSIIFMCGLTSTIIDKEKRNCLNSVFQSMKSVNDRIENRSVINGSITLVQNIDLMTIR
ncbi:hypothetical protein AQUCO_00300872v1 [Aquilegia coerulea]|uniref:Protein kinase domain-containing protein n=1 Tax=Aquilegia coerulea TaxID=218851 RepID=A0A2G5F0X2_AQUCA|nr:hypothetical protein AQUCO_00300872v1 [Aquilegia coerulea]